MAAVLWAFYWVIAILSNIQLHSFHKSSKTADGTIMQNSTHASYSSNTSKNPQKRMPCMVPEQVEDLKTLKRGLLSALDLLVRPRRRRWSEMN